MNYETLLMQQIYQTYDVDWMGDEIKDPSDLTRHHIIKREKNGESDVSNYALLTTDSHHLIHYLEENYHDCYVYLNNMFLELNRSLKPPTIEYYEKVKLILKKVKKDIKNKRRFASHKR